MFQHSRRALESVWRTATVVSLISFAVAAPSFNSVPAAAQTTGINWPANQQFPSFASFDTLDMIDLTAAPTNASDQRIMFSTLEGIVNRTRPRIYMLDDYFEGKNYWPERLTGITQNSVSDPFTLITKYRSELQGVVIYDPGLLDTVNLATTIAGVRSAIVVSPSLATTLNAAPYNLPTLIDLRTANNGGAFTSNVQVYQYARDNYWSQTTRRMLIASQPQNTSYLRDYAVAVKAMVVWLDVRNSAEQAIMNSFLDDMPINSPFVGWYPDEPSGVDNASRRNIPTIPGDYIANGSVWGGTPRGINVRAVPPTPPLQNKIYVSIVMSDGDNVQLNQHQTPRKWSDPRRGQVPITWTLSPASVDIQPFILNYYNQTATDNDAIVSGPSGLGYTYAERWSEAGLNIYTETSGRYLTAAGMRVVTVWNDFREPVSDYTSALKTAYVQNMPNLLGVTLQQVNGSIWNGKLPALRVSTEYGQSAGDLINGINNASSGFNGSSPRFIAVQGDANNPGITPSLFYDVQQSYASNPNVVFVRGDHLFQLYRQYNGLPANGGDTTLEYTFDSGAQSWIGATAGGQYDSAIWDNSTGNPAGSLRLDGSDMGSPNGGVNSSFSKLLAVPANAQTFSFDTRGAGPANGGQLRARLIDASGVSHTLLNWETYQSATWVRRSANIEAYAGQTVTVLLEHNDSGPGIGEQRWIDSVRIGLAASTVTNWTFDSDRQGWTGTAAGGPYDSAIWDSATGNPSGALRLDGSDMGSPNSGVNATFSNVIQLSSNAQTLNFQTRGAGPANGGQLRVRLVTSGGTSVTLLNWETYQSAAWVNRSANIAAYAGQVVTIVFEHNDSGAGSGEQRWIDNINIGQSASNQVVWTFDSNAQGWNGTTAGGQYDSAIWDSTTGTPAGSLRLDGSDFGNPNGGVNSTFSNTVVLPADAQTLSFDTRGAGPANGGQLRVRLVTSGGTSVTLLNWETYQTTTWVNRSANIAAYAGQSVTIYFEHNDSGPGIGEQRWIDNVTISGSSSGAPQIAPTFAP